MRRLQSRNINHGRLESIQRAAMPVVCRQADTTDQATTNTQSAGHATDDSGADWGGGVWVTRSADTGAGGGKGNGSAAGGSEA